MLRMTHSLSACCAMCGRKSLTSTPELPYFLNGLTGASSGFFATLRRVITSPKLSGNGWPAYFCRSDLGSNRSTWLGPPCMNSQSTRFALGSKCGGLGASGCATFPVGSADDCMAAVANSLSPPPATERNWRREVRIPIHSCMRITIVLVYYHR